MLSLYDGCNDLSYLIGGSFCYYFNCFNFNDGFYSYYV